MAIANKINLHAFSWRFEFPLFTFTQSQLTRALITKPTDEPPYSHHHFAPRYYRQCRYSSTQRKTIHWDDGGFDIPDASDYSSELAKLSAVIVAPDETVSEDYPKHQSSRFSSSLPRHWDRSQLFKLVLGTPSSTRWPLPSDLYPEHRAHLDEISYSKRRNKDPSSQYSDNRAHSYSSPGPLSSVWSQDPGGAVRNTVRKTPR